MFRSYPRASDPDARATARDAQAGAREAQTDVVRLEREVERLLIVTEALWSIVRDRHGLTDDDLDRTIREIDLRDGKLDGKLARGEAKKCPECDRPLPRSKSFCLYCGAAVERAPFER